MLHKDSTWFHVLLMTLVTGLTLGIMPSLRSEARPRTCAEVATAARQHLAQIRNLSLRPELHSIAKVYPDYPVGRPDEYRFIMRGRAVHAVMNSPELMKIIAKNIIEACETVSLVTFGLDGSGWSISIGLQSNDQVDFFKCAEDFGIYPGRGGGRFGWGFYYCSL